MTISFDIYDEDYYQRGIETAKSLYQNYRWIPEMTIPMAMTMIDLLNIKPGEKILELGCAYGFLVKAFRLLHREAFGLEVSKHAINSVDPSVKDFCFLIDSIECIKKFEAEYCIAKDVFEHMLETDVEDFLNNLQTQNLFAVIPLGENGVFEAPANNLDVTHITCHTKEWWDELFKKCGWILHLSSYRVPGIKDSYYDKYPTAHGFFHLKR
jgi:hypothetical protein